MGILLFFVLVGNMPFAAATVPALRNTILKGEYRIPGNFTAPCVKLIRELCLKFFQAINIIYFFEIECILLHNPAHRPTVDLILRSQWVQQRSKRPQSPLQEARSIIHRRKKASFWCSKSRKTSPMSPNHAKKQPEYVDCNTKKYNNIPAEKFKNPLEYTPSSATTVIPIHNSLNPVTRNNSLINSSKIILKRNNRNGPIEIIQVRSYSNDASEETVEENDNNDFDQFMMTPTKTSSCDESLLRTLHPLELETRNIMDSLGIGRELLEKGIEHGPRSEVIGVYRIIIMRLKTQREQSSPVISPILENVKKNYQSKKQNATKCAIL